MPAVVLLLSLVTVVTTSRDYHGGLTMNRRWIGRAAKELGISFYRLRYLVTAGKIPAPATDEYGKYAWTDADLERARAALAADRQRRECRNAGATQAALTF